MTTSLFFKEATSGKAPFIGICWFDFDVFFARRINEDLLDKFEPLEVHIRVIGKGRADVSLLGKASGRLRTYTGVNYNPVELAKWAGSVNNRIEVNFGHISQSCNSKFEIVRTQNSEKPFYFPVEQIFVFLNDTYTTLKMIE